ncbi:Uncharacterised protein [Mycobacteroides abscessus subsp. abscessus]|nr:Uncharacterised protein [Mycobacteroides abscessus subsp. abscessus]
MTRVLLLRKIPSRNRLLYLMIRMQKPVQKKMKPKQMGQKKTAQRKITASLAAPRQPMTSSGV